jgi:urease alpha subunit
LSDIIDVVLFGSVTPLAADNKLDFQPLWGANAASAELVSLTFVSKISIISGVIKSYGLSRRLEAVKKSRGYE